MPPLKPKTIAVNVAEDTIKNNTPFYIYNRNTGDRWMQLCLAETSSANALFDLNNPTQEGVAATAWANNHVLEIHVLGIAYGYAEITLDETQSQEVTVSVTADDGPALTI